MTDVPELPIDPALARRMDAELRREMAEAEAQSRQLVARSRQLVEALAESVQRGDRLTVVSGSAQYSGVAVYARGDLVSVESASAVVECQLGVIDSVIVDDPSDEPGRAVAREAESFAARLGLVQLGRESVEVVTAGAATRIHGVIEAVGRDHVVVAMPGGRRQLIGLARIAFVVRGGSQ